MPLKDRAARLAYMRQYNVRPSTIAARRLYDATPEAKEAQRRRRDATPEARERARLRAKTAAAKLSATRYVRSPLGRATARACRLRKRYSLTPEAHAAMLESQGGVCAICRGSSGQRSFSVDHCHHTGRVRGILCHKCNCGLGNLLDDPARVRAALAYLEAGAL